MAQQGTVTIMVRLNTTQAEADLEALKVAASRMSIEYQRIAETHSRAVAQEFQAQRKGGEEALAMRRRLDDQISSSTMGSMEYRIQLIRKEAQEQDRIIRQMAISRKQQEELIYKNVAAMETQITAIRKAEDERRKRLQTSHVVSISSVRASNQPEPPFGLMDSIATGPVLAQLGIASIEQAIATLSGAMQFAVQESAEFESAMKALESVSKVTGANFEESKGLVSEFSDAISSSTSVAQAVRVFTSMNMSMDEQRRLISSIREGIVAMGGDVNTQLPLMAQAIKRQESVLLENMGVTTAIETMYREYARTLGTTVDKLTQAQKEQAIVNGVINDASVYAGSAKSSNESFVGSINNLRTASSELGKEIGDVVNPALIVMNNLLAEGVRNMAGFVREFPKTLLEGGKGLTVQTRNAGKQSRIVGGEVPITTKEGGLVIPGLNAGIGLPKFKILTKQEQKLREQAAWEASEKAKEAAKEQQEVAQRIAADQNRLREQLNNDLALIDLQGFERERVQAMQAHQERLKQARYYESLKGEQRKRADDLAEQSLTIYNKQIVQINQNEADEVDARIERETKESKDARLASIVKTSESERSLLDAGSELTADDRIASLEAEKAKILELGDLRLEELDRIEEIEKQIALTRAQANKEDLEKRKQIAELAIQTMASLGTEAIRDGGISGGNMTRSIGGLASAGLAMIPGVGWAASAVTSLATGWLSSWFDSQDQAVDEQKRAAEEQRRAADEQRKAAEEQRHAAEQTWQNYLEAKGQVSDATRELDWEKRLAAAEGTASHEDIRAQVEKEKGIVGRIGAFENSVSAIADGTKGIIPWADGEAPQRLLDQFSTFAQGLVGDGEFSEADKQALFATYGEDNLFTHAMTAGLGNDLIQAIQNLADGISLEENRVLPGSSPQNPSYNVIVNFKDLWSFMPKEGFFRAGGPGTRRDDGGGRGVGIGGGG